MSLEFSLTGLYTNEPRFALTHLELYTFLSVAIRAKKQSIQRDALAGLITKIPTDTAPAFYTYQSVGAPNSTPTLAPPSPSPRRPNARVALADATHGSFS